MPYCPACRVEYVHGSQVCADCLAALVDGTPPVWDPAAERIAWEPVVGVPHQVAGVLMQGILEAADIPVLFEEHTLTAYGALPSSANVDSWGDLLVPHEHVTEAAGLLREYLDGLSEPAATEQDGGPEDSRRDPLEQDL